MNTKPIIIIAIFCCITTKLFSLPIIFDLSAEPSVDDTTLNGSLGYLWNDNLSSTMYVSWKNTIETSSEMEGYSNVHDVSQYKNLEIILLPYERNFTFDPFNVGLSAGLSYIWLKESTNTVMKDINGYMLEPAGQYFAFLNDRTATIIAPRFGGNFNIVIFEMFKLDYEAYVNPIYFLHMEQTMSYDPIVPTLTNSLDRWSTPYFEQTLAINFNKAIRFSVHTNYQRIDFQTMDWSEDGLNLEAKDDIQSIFTYRIGIDFLIPAKGDLKIKGGIYLEHTSNTSSYWGNLDNSYKYVTSYGSENY